jgi:hypothetical protein
MNRKERREKERRARLLNRQDRRDRVTCQQETKLAALVSPSAEVMSIAGANVSAGTGFAPVSTALDAATHAEPSAASSPKVASGLTTVPINGSGKESTTGATGPRSAEGKAVSSRNAAKYNLCAKRLTGADLDEYNEILRRYHDDWEPQTETERQLLAQMAISQWRLDRALALELDAFDRSELDASALALVLRYRTSAERGYHKALRELQRIRAAMAADARALDKEEEELRQREIEHYIMGPIAPTPRFVSQNGVAPASAVPEFVSHAQRPVPPPFVSQNSVSPVDVRG